MNKEEFLKDIKNFIENHKEQYNKKVLVSSVIVKEKGGLVWYNCITKFRLMGKNENIIPRKDIVYDIFGLLESIISIEEMINILENIENGFKIKDFEIKFDGSVDFSYRVYEASNNDYCDFAGNEYWIGGLTVHQIRFPTVKYGVPCFRDGNHAIRSWLNLTKFHNFSDARLGKIILFVPNFKARIKNLELKNDKLIVAVEGYENIIEDLECQLVYTIGNDVFHENVSFLSKTEVYFDMADEPDEIFIQLVTPEGEKIDYYEDTPYRHTGKERLLKRKISKDVIERIKNGENEIVEFKPFVYKSDPKEKEVIETIIAFSNTKGGVPFIWSKG